MDKFQEIDQRFTYCDMLTVAMYVFFEGRNDWTLKVAGLQLRLRDEYLPTFIMIIVTSCDQVVHLLWITVKQILRNVGHCLLVDAALVAET